MTPSTTGCCGAHHLARLRGARRERQRDRAKLLLLAAEDPDKDIYLYINSPGGSITAGMAIYDTMQYVPNDIVTVGIGMAASMGQLLLTAGTKGKRYITPNARVLLHQPHGGFGGTATDIQTQAELILDMKKRARRDHRRADRQDRRADQRRRRPRPLVHRPGGARVRLRRPRPQGRRGRRRRRHGLTAPTSQL